MVTSLLRYQLANATGLSRKVVHKIMSEQQQLKSTIRTDLFLTLPRELRDEIYADALKVTPPVELTLPASLHWIPPVLQREPTLLAESLEAFYKVNTFVVNLKDDLSNVFAGSPTVHAQPSAHIRQLIIICDESSCTEDTMPKYEETNRTHPDRLRWEKLYEIPHLQQLTLRMEKSRDLTLQTGDFGPILYDLRAQRPGFKITFELSYDYILKKHWDDPIWTQFNGDPQSEYHPMGYVDMSDLMEPPTDEDLRHVQEYLKIYWDDKFMPMNRSIERGLLDETPEHRRILAAMYAVKEPALLRCLMAEHYKVYKSYRK